MSKEDLRTIQREIDACRELLDKLEAMKHLPEGSFVIGVGSSGEGVSGYELPSGRRVYL
jgi:hypothetical protein